jgi:hypothetical protein
MRSCVCSEILSCFFFVDARIHKQTNRKRGIELSRKLTLKQAAEEMIPVVSPYDSHLSRLSVFGADIVIYYILTLHGTTLRWRGHWWYTFISARRTS